MAEFKISRLKYTWKGEWSSGTTYYTDDVVSYGGKAYVCLEEHTAESGEGFYNDLSSVVTNTNPPEPAPRWEQMIDGTAWTGNWQANIPYNVNDIVKYGAIVYKCLTPHTSSSLAGVSPSFVLSYGLENDQSKWEIIAKTEDWKTDWQTDYPYRLNDIVKYGAVVYRCITPHISAATTNLGLEVDSAKWETVHSGIEYKSTFNSTARYKINDVVKYGGQTYICIQNHLSAGSFNEANWQIYVPGQEYENNWSSVTEYQKGDVVKYGGYSYYALTNNLNKVPPVENSDWQLLSIGYNWRDLFNIATSYKLGDVVRRNGNVYACILDSVGNDPTSTTYWKLIAEGRQWRDIWANATSYQLEDLATFEGSVYRCIQQHTSNSTLRPDKQTALTYWILVAQANITNQLRNVGDLVVYGLDEEDLTVSYTRLPIGSEGQLLKNVNNFATWDTWSDVNKVYYVGPNGADQADRGTTIDRPWASINYACTQVTGPATIFVKSGIYSEILPISVPAGVAVVGDELRSVIVQPAGGYTTSNMFYMRNATGLRNMTLQGLTGTLGSSNIYGTKRPSAGAYVSLDPGSGPSDTSVWITTRSPYIQNVTTFGTACVGMKIDGDLHNGGNKSIVANDFTQVLSDGIGVWATNNSLTELVSVFSYYNHIGYLAENGAKVRAANGNSSYGTYGCVAEGVSLNETPITGNINNRSTEAIVASAFSGQIGDQILILEYENCGQSYSNASFTITGAGINAAATPTYRDGGVFEVRVKAPDENTAPGGAGYKLVSNNAQAGDSTSITLASNDTNTPAQLLGLRVVVTSGTGTGQYGYIQAYDDTSKIATIYKESDDTPGWDHVAGFSIEPLLDSSVTYSVEPRVIFTNPVSGITAKGRAIVLGGKISMIKIWDCGSGYTSSPSVTIIDPNNTSEVLLEPRISNGVLGPVTWSNRGVGYQTSTTRVTVTGNGFADKYQVGPRLILQNVTTVPGAGDNLTITGINNEIYKIIRINSVSGVIGNYQVSLDLFPELTVFNSPNDSVSVSIRQRYSQIRLTGHDFLDIGTGNITDTDYPDLYQTYDYLLAPENEVVESGGGRIFYTATDQDGNFRVGELFKVDQATGTVTISASLFNLAGLEELALGGFTVGGSGTIIREFSTDIELLADSNNIVSTQKAIKGYLQSRVSGGNSDAFTTALTAGVVTIGPNLITTTTQEEIKINTKTNFKQPISGSALAFSFYSNSWTFESSDPSD